MSLSVSNRRKAENEVIFRRHNENIQKGFDEIKQYAEEDNQKHLIPDNDGIALHFYCECSDENCRLRIPLRTSEYNEIHKNRRQFVIVPGHETSRIEKIVSQEEDYYIVEKSLVPHVSKVSFKALNTTDTNNV
jgi:hypothetical protein